MANTISALMGLSIPVVGETLSPAWASDINAALLAIDAHDHTPGSGAQIRTAAINIDGSLTFNDYDATDFRTVRLGDQTSITLGATDLRAIYVKDGDLYYRNASAQEVQVTVGSSIAGASGSIGSLTSPASATFSSSLGQFIWLADTGKYAKMANSDIQLFEYNNASAQSITIKSPASVGSAYTITLPGAVPSQAGVVSMNTSGTLSTGLADGALASPGLAFASDLNTGAYRIGSDNWALVSGGTANWTFSTTANTANLPIYGSNTATASAPAYSFISDTNTGIYSSGADILNFTTGGTNRFSISSTTVTSALPYSGTTATLSGGLSATTGTFSGVVNGPVGSASAPTYAFTGDTNTGIYRSASATLSITTNGTKRIDVSSSALASTVPVTLADGTSLFPSFAFTSQVSTGMFRPTSGAIGFAAGLAEQARFSSSGLCFGGDTTASFRWKYFTGSVSASSTATISTGVTVAGVFGYDSTANMPIGTDIVSGGGSVAVLRFGTAGSNEIGLVNGTGSTHSYRIIVFY